MRLGWWHKNLLYSVFIRLPYRIYPEDRGRQELPILSEVATGLSSPPAWNRGKFPAPHRTLEFA